MQESLGTGTFRGEYWIYISLVGISITYYRTIQWRYLPRSRCTELAYDRHTVCRERVLATTGAVSIHFVCQSSARCHRHAQFDPYHWEELFNPSPSFGIPRHSVAVPKIMRRMWDLCTICFDGIALVRPLLIPLLVSRNWRLSYLHCLSYLHHPSHCWVWIVFILVFIQLYESACHHPIQLILMHLCQPTDPKTPIQQLSKF